MPRLSEGGLDELLASETVREPFVEGFLHEGQIGILVGGFGTGKSYFSTQLSIALAAGVDWVDKLVIPRPRSVLYVQTEGTVADLQERVRPAIERYPGADVMWRWWVPDDLDLSEAAFQQQLESRLKGIEVLFLDSFYSSFPSLDMTKSADVSTAFRTMRRIRNQSSDGLAMVLLHHEHRPRRDAEGVRINEGAEAVYGSVFIQAAADRIWHWTWDKLEGHPAKLVDAKTRSRREGVEDLSVQMDASGLIVVASDGNANKTEAHDQLIAYVKTMGTVEWPKLVEYAAHAWERSERTLYRHVREIEGLGFLKVDRESRPVVVYWVAGND